MKYKILFIDEEKESHNDFKDFVENQSMNNKLDIMTELPSANLEEMIETMIYLNPDAIITDYLLNEKKVDVKENIPYNGNELIQRFTAIRKYFPCFVLTSYDSSAIKDNYNDDVNIVYVKNILHEEAQQNTMTFLDRIVTQIEHYKKKIRNSEEELLNLIELKRQNKINCMEEDKMIELDKFLEEVVDARSRVPDSLKAIKNSQMLHSLLDQVEALLQHKH